MSVPKKTVRCPACHGPSRWDENPFKPFCSERCQLLDLGNWLGGQYKISGERQEIPEEDLASFQEEAKTRTLH